MRGMPVLYQLLRAGELDKLDELAAASLRVRQVESAARGRGHVLVSVDPSGQLGAYQATITTEAGTAQLWFDPESEASRILHSAGVTKISGKRPVSAYVPADIAVQLARMAERPA